MKGKKMKTKKYTVINGCGVEIEIGLSLNAAKKLVWKLAKEQDPDGKENLGEWNAESMFRDGVRNVGGVCPENNEGGYWPTWKEES